MKQCVGFLIVAWGATVSATGQSIEIVTLTSSGGQVGPDCEYPSVSADGRFVSFLSSDPNLAPAGTNGLWRVFVRDRLLGTTELASVSTTGVQAAQHCKAGQISIDGRFVCFSSGAANLIPADNNSAVDVFVRDRLLGTTERISLSSSGAEATGGSYSSSISADGRFVAFSSLATNLVPGDTNATWDIFVRDRASGTTERVSVATGGAQGSLESRWNPSISADGRFVCFTSRSPNLVTGDNNNADDIFVRDRLLGTTERVSLATGGVEANFGAGYSGPISGDGRFICFQSGATNLVAGDTNSTWDIFLRDRVLDVTERMSVSSNGTQGNALCQSSIGVSDDGRFVVFNSLASNLVAGDTNGAFDVFLRDRLAQTTTRMSQSMTGSSVYFDSNSPWISASGRFVTFRSFASDFVPGDINQAPDVFLRDLGPQPLSPFCSGDGSGTPCPCANASDAHRGCLNSLTVGGLLSGFGSVSLGADTLTLVASDVTGPGLFFQGTSRVGGGAGDVFGDGLHCAGGTIARLGIVAPNGTSAQYPGGFSPNPIHIAGGPLAPGDVRHYQCLYRDTPASCTVYSYNLTNGATLTWQP